MGKRDLVMAVGLAAALALPAASAAAGGRGQSALHAHKHGRGHKTGQTSTQSGKSSLVRKNVRQFEGMVVAVSPQGVGNDAAAAAASGLQVRTMGSRPVTVTVLLTASTQLSVEQVATGTVGQSASTAQLAVGQRVHVMATPDPDGSYTAVRLIMQGQKSDDSATTDADSDTPGRPEHPGHSTR